MKRIFIKIFQLLQCPCKHLLHKTIKLKYQNISVCKLKKKHNAEPIVTAPVVVIQEPNKIQGENNSIFEYTEKESLQCDSVLRKRHRKMKKHKHRKRLKKTRALRKRQGKI